MVKGKALYPFGTGATTTWTGITDRTACMQKCIETPETWGCEWESKFGKCHGVKGPVTELRNPCCTYTNAAQPYSVKTSQPEGSPTKAPTNAGADGGRRLL